MEETESRGGIISCYWPDGRLGLHYVHELVDPLMKHQESGIEWMFNLHMEGKGGILADDMGMGKTRQVCAFLKGLFNTSSITRVLIVASPTVLPTWHGELDTMKLTWHELTSSMDGAEEFDGIGIFLVTYDSLVREPQIVRDLLWDKVILDEGHLLKNPETKKAAAVRKINVKEGGIIILSGTVIQNALMDLWAVMNICNPALLGDQESFEYEYEEVIKAGNYADIDEETDATAKKKAKKLQKQIQLYYLRRDKKLLDKLPAKHELVIWLTLAPFQEYLYMRFLKKRSSEKHIFGHTYSSMQQLQMICSHPHIWLSRNVEEDMQKLMQSFVDDAGTELGVINELERSVKFVFLSDLLPELIQEKRSLLIFSQSIQLLVLLERVLLRSNYEFRRLCGKTSRKDRKEYVDGFQAGNFPILLLSTKVGALGLTLTKATRVIILDPAWNPSSDSQAVDRAYRMGQSEDVIVYRLICSGTIEERVYRKQISKNTLSGMVFDKDPPTKYFNSYDRKATFEATKHEFHQSGTKAIVDMRLANSDQNKLDELLKCYMKNLEKKKYIAGVSYHNHVVLAHQKKDLWSRGESKKGFHVGKAKSSPPSDKRKSKGIVMGNSLAKSSSAVARHRQEKQLERPKESPAIPKPQERRKELPLVAKPKQERPKEPRKGYGAKSSAGGIVMGKSLAKSFMNSSAIARHRQEKPLERLKESLAIAKPQERPKESRAIAKAKQERPKEPRKGYGAQSSMGGSGSSYETLSPQKTAADQPAYGQHQQSARGAFVQSPALQTPAMQTGYGAQSGKGGSWYSCGTPLPQKPAGQPAYGQQSAQGVYVQSTALQAGYRAQLSSGGSGSSYGTPLPQKPYGQPSVQGAYVQSTASQAGYGAQSSIGGFGSCYGTPPPYTPGQPMYGQNQLSPAAQGNYGTTTVSGYAIPPNQPSYRGHPGYGVPPNSQELFGGQSYEGYGFGLYQQSPTAQGSYAPVHPGPPYFQPPSSYGGQQAPYNR